MGSGVEGISLPGQVNESQEQGKMCNMDEGIGILENMEVRCSRPCSAVTMNSLTSESVENSPPLLLNDVELTHMETNGHEVEVSNAFTASEKPATCCTRKHIETDCRKVCDSQSPATNSTCSEENIEISSSVVHDRVHSACEGDLHDESPHVKIYRRKKRRIHESSDVSLNSIKDETSALFPALHDNVGNTSEEHSCEELLHGKRLDCEVQNAGSCPLIQIAEASPPKEDASGVTSKVETGDVRKTCSPVGPVEKQSQMTMKEMVPSSDKDLASKTEISQANIDRTVLPQERPMSISPNKKLLVLDVNGLLADIVFLDIPCERTPDTIISGKAVFTRPFYKDFLDFCFTHFNVGIWTSRTKRNVELILDFLLGESKKKLLFCWDQYHCTDSGFGSVEDRNKPLIVKKLKKLWEKHDPNLPWKRGQFNESNTLLLDDTPHKALCNPPHTAIFPESFRYTNANDTSLAPEGELRAYLKGLAEAENVQKYVQENRFGQRPITEKNLSWRYYQKVIAACSPPSSEANCKRYASSNSKAFTEAAPYNRNASYNRRDNHPSSCSDDTSRRNENYQWKANHSSFGLEATRCRHGSDHWKADNHSSSLEAARHRHGSDHGKSNNNSSSSFSEAVPCRRSYHAEAYNSARNFSSTSEGNGFRRGTSDHWKATHATSPFSKATPPDRHGSRSYHLTNSHSSSSFGGQAIPAGRRWTTTHASPSAETIPDRRGSYHWEHTR